MISKAPQTKLALLNKSPLLFSFDRCILSTYIHRTHILCIPEAFPDTIVSIELRNNMFLIDSTINFTRSIVRSHGIVFFIRKIVNNNTIPDLVDLRYY